MKKRVELRVDPISCDGHGLCAELFPERVVLDEWGYPMIDGHAIPKELEPHAQRAVSECPKGRPDADFPPELSVPCLSNRGAARRQR